EDPVEQLALEAPRDRAPVAPHGLQPDQLEPLAGRPVDQAGVALLAPGRAAADLGHPEPAVDLLELELEPAPHAELAPERVRDVLADVRAERLPERRRPRGVGLA